MNAIQINWSKVKDYVNDDVPTSEMSVAQRAFHAMCFDANISICDYLTIIIKNGVEYFDAYEYEEDEGGNEHCYPYKARLSDYGVTIAGGMLVPISDFLEELCENTHAF